MRRITFEGPDLATFPWSGPAAHIKLIPPDPGSNIAPVPEPDGPRPASMRTYTPRRFDPTAGTLTVDFVLHGEGPASSWAARAEPGQQLTIMGPGRSYAVDPDAAWYVLACDQTALPAVETILEALPATAAVTVFIEADDAAEERPLAGPANADVRWLVRSPDAGPGQPLEEALAHFTWPSGDGRIYVGCESNAMRRLRPMIVERSGQSGARVVTRGYWRVGINNNPDHDYAED
jgi:NADPH-dependent ferric siderophore reductase